MTRMSSSCPSNESAKPTLLVLAAGMGSRFGGLKQIAALGPSGETVLEYSVFDAIRAGFDRAVFVIRRDFESQFREQVGRRFEKKIDVDYAFQSLDDLPSPFAVPHGRTKPWGTAHAVLAARKVVHAPFAVINADDFYGADAYVKLAEFLSSAANGRKPAEFCLVAYLLGKTLSENGTVSRGVCKVDDDGCLESITEREKIRKSAVGPQALCGDEWQNLGFDTPVSMNMMGFTIDLLPMLEERFRIFLKARAEEAGAECYLPESVSFAIASKWAVVKVLKTDGEWMGITYPGDKDNFSRAVVAKHGNGEYPRNLWL
jgi:choline kinase